MQPYGSRTTFRFESMERFAKSSANARSFRNAVVHCVVFARKESSPTRLMVQVRGFGFDP